jgi:hypothetical protein
MPGYAHFVLSRDSFRKDLSSTRPSAHCPDSKSPADG